jgi:hypothetical protein
MPRRTSFRPFADDLTVRAWLDELARLSPKDYADVVEKFRLVSGDTIADEILAQVAATVRELLDELRKDVSLDPKAKLRAKFAHLKPTPWNHRASK